MTLRRALGIAATDLYHQSWRLIVLNALLAAVLVGVILASLAIRPRSYSSSCSAPSCSGHALRGYSRPDGGASARGVAGWAATALASRDGAGAPASPCRPGRVVVPFYARAGTWAWPLAALSLYVCSCSASFQLALWPLAVFEDGAPLRAVVRDAALMVARRPSGSSGWHSLYCSSTSLGVAAAILPFLTLTISYSFLVSAHFALPKNPAREA